MRYPRDDGSTLTLFEDLDITISRGERWGVVGPNGAGKSTLVECLLNKREPSAGHVKHGAGLKVGYFSQGRGDMDPMTTVPRHIQRVVARLADTEEGPDKPKLLSEQEARDLAGAFLFSGDRQESLLGDMSGGERARAALAALLACARNVLVLDEPTNHLDIPSAERLEALLERGQGKKSGTFDGTLIVVSHDRTLIDAVCDHLIVFDGKGRVSLHMGGWSDWLAGGARAISAPEPTKRTAPPPAPPPAPAPKKKAGKSKFSWMPVEAIEQKIQELEGEISRIDAQLDDPEIWKDAVRAAEINAKRDDLKAELDDLETEWLGRV